ncbi:MAG: M15 family metallopeptidase [Deltaproteobacteria bacterium]|nr:M15 family metallopeptidase [Deltaproteobacteria bacterium]
MIPRKAALFVFLLCLPALLSAKENHQDIPQGFTDLSLIEPTIIVETRYFSSDNFIGKRINGYEANKCYLTTRAAHALKAVQQDLKKQGLSLKIYDCYRPQRAVDHFVRWAKDLTNTAMKKQFYPDVEKKDLFKDGYIAQKSGHSRGSTVDLTLIPLTGLTPPAGQAQDQGASSYLECAPLSHQRLDTQSIDMGTGFDCFDPRSHTLSSAISPAQLTNRQKLKTMMERHHFVNYTKEWWHYTLKDEPYPKTYFDFVVKQVPHLTLTRLNSSILRGRHPRSVDFEIHSH